MGNEPIKADDFVRTYAQATNLATDRNIDGSLKTGPFMEPTEYMLMGGMGLFTVGSQRKQLLTKPTWNGQTVSRWQYGKNVFKANFSSFSNFNNMEFIDTRVQKLEGIIKSKAPQLPKDFRFNNPRVERLYNQLLNARSPREYSELIRRADEFERQFGRGRSRTSVYKQLCRALQKHPNELAKLKNLPQYRQIYGNVINDFQQAQTTMRNCRSLPKGRVAELHKLYAEARLAENQLINSNSAKVGAGRWARGTARMSSGVKNAMAASKTMRTLSRGAGRVGGAAAIALSVANAGVETYSAYAMAKELHPEKAGTIAAKQAGKSVAKAGIEIGGAWAGAKIGAMAGACFGPVGAAVGGLVGGLLGWAAGSLLAKKTPVINESETDKMQAEINNAQKNKVQEAIEADNIEALADNMVQFYEIEQVMDENGKVSMDLKKDEDGNPILKKVSDNKEEQLAFEQRVADLNNYVMTEAAKREEAEKLKKEVEEAEKLRLQQQQMDFGGSLTYGNSYAPSDYAPSDTTKTSGYGVNGNGSFGSYTTDWRNPAWQNSLANLYNSSNFYSFNPNNYTPLWAMNGKNFYAPAA